jgi:hypothetical protein
MDKKIEKIIDKYCIDLCESKKEGMSGEEFMDRRKALLNDINYDGDNFTFDPHEYIKNGLRQAIIDSALNIRCWEELISKIGYKKVTKMKLLHAYEELGMCFIGLVKCHYEQLEEARKL